jgi:antitoxin MazE
MKVALIRIGKSKGIRLPKPILDRCGIEDAVELEIEDDRLIVRPARPPRFGWSDAFAKISRRGDDSLLDEESTSSWDRTDWHW